MGEPVSVGLEELGLDGIEGAAAGRVGGEGTIFQDEFALDREDFGEGFGGAVL